MAPLSSTTDGSAGAPVLVLSSSLGTTRDMWMPQMETLGRHFRVVRFDHPGHGESAVWDEPVTVGGIGAAVVDLLDQLEFDRVSFCGLSLGGAVGQWLAAHVPERIERLVLCSTSANFAPKETYLQRAALVREQGMVAISSAALERWFTADFRSRQPAVVANIRSMLESTPTEGYASCCEAVAKFDGRDDLPSIVAPTLVVVGIEDLTTTTEHARGLQDRIPHARLLAIPQAAHLLNVEQPTVVENAILEHLGETGNG